MDLGQTVEILTRVGLSAVAAFLAILLWSNTRDTAWMFIVVGLVVEFAQVMYSTLELFGIVQENVFTLAGIAVGRVVLIALPYIFFCIAVIIMIARNRVRYEAIASELRSEERTLFGKRKERKKLKSPPLGDVEGEAERSDEAGAPGEKEEQPGGGPSSERDNEKPGID
jgi:hypothetical protein